MFKNPRDLMEKTQKIQYEIEFRNNRSFQKIDHFESASNTNEIFYDCHVCSAYSVGIIATYSIRLAVAVAVAGLIVTKQNTKENKNHAHPHTTQSQCWLNTKFQ